MIRTGSGCKTGKMSIEDVKRFKAEMFDGEPISEKEKRYPVGRGALYDIRAGLTWRDVKPDRQTQ